MPENIKPIELLFDEVKWWRLFAAFLILGAAAGWAGWSIRKPIYESKASISVMIDFTRTGKLSDIEEDLAMVAVGDIIKSSQVKDEVVVQSEVRGVSLKGIDLEEITFLERQNEKWILRVRDEKASDAKELANLWANISFAALQDAYGHALKADVLEKYTDSLVNCLEQSAAVEPVQTECGISNLEGILSEIENTNVLVKKEKLDGQGIMAASTFRISERAGQATDPVRYGRGVMIISGAIMGFFIAALSILMGLPGWIKMRK